MTSPRISVVMATYNHADFVQEAIESVLRQRGVDFELLVADDGSADRTREVVASVHDARVHFFPSATNRGACTVTNELLDRATGEFVALMNSDDRWIAEDKLASQLAILTRDPSIGACFGRARFVDIAGRAINKATLPFGRVFDQENRSRGAWLRRFFDLGNCLCHPTMLIRRSCYETLGMYDNRLRQLPDFDMWVRLLRRYDIHVSDADLVDFRWLPGENASAVTADNSQRTLSEMYFILRAFFDGMPRDVFLDGFGDLLVNADVPDEPHMDIEQALLYCRRDDGLSHVHRQIGLEKLHGLLGSDAHRDILNDEYGVSDRTFQSMAGEVGAWSEPVEALQRQLAAANEVVRVVERSTSWRVTAPLRRIADTTRGLRRRTS